MIEEFVSREGTDYGHDLTNLPDKVRQVKAQLESGAAVVVYDDDSLSCTIRPAVNGKLDEKRTN